MLDTMVNILVGTTGLLIAGFSNFPFLTCKTLNYLDPEGSSELCSSSSLREEPHPCGYSSRAAIFQPHSSWITGEYHMLLKRRRRRKKEGTEDVRHVAEAGVNESVTDTRWR